MGKQGSICQIAKRLSNQFRGGHDFQKTSIAPSSQIDFATSKKLSIRSHVEINKLKQEMELKALEELKNEWFENARKEGKFSKLSQIARHLGENIRHNWGPKYGFTDGDIKIYVDDYGNYMTVHDGGRLVCSTHNERVYIPAVCDEIIAKHFPAAEEIKARKDDEKLKQKEAALHKELFG